MSAETTARAQVDERPAPPANLVRERNLYRAHTHIIHRYSVPEEVLRWTQQIRKGSTRLAILQLVSERERYGYEIVMSIRNRTNGGRSEERRVGKEWRSGGWVYTYKETEETK